MADASPTVIPAAGAAAEQRHKLTVKVASGRDLPRMNDTSYPNPYVCISAFEEQEMNQIQIGRLDHKVKNTLSRDTFLSKVDVDQISSLVYLCGRSDGFCCRFAGHQAGDSRLEDAGGTRSAAEED
jgi:hypothetical protein